MENIIIITDTLDKMKLRNSFNNHIVVIAENENEAKTFYPTFYPHIIIRPSNLNIENTKGLLFVYKNEQEMDKIVDKINKISA